MMDSWDPMSLSNSMNKIAQQTQTRTKNQPAPNNQDKSQIEMAVEQDASLQNFNAAVTNFIVSGANNAAGTSGKTPLVQLSQERIDGIAERLAFRPNAFDSESVLLARNEQLNEEFDEVTTEFTQAVAKAMVKYEIKNPKNAKNYGIDIDHLNASAEWWTNKQYQIYDWRVLRITGVNVESVQGAFINVQNCLCTCEDVMLDLQTLWEIEVIYIYVISPRLFYFPPRLLL